MPNHVPLRLHVRLLSPAIVTQPIHLDGLLWQALVRMGMRPDDALAAIPLSAHEYPGGRFYLGTAGIASGEGPVPPVIDARFLICGHRDVGEFGATEAALKKIGMKKPSPAISKLPAIGAMEMVFFGIGDIDAISDLLPAIDGIGKRTRQGMGEVDLRNTRVTALGAAHATFPWRLPDGQPTRHTPWSVWQGMGGMESACRGRARLGPPYWDAVAAREDAAFAMSTYVQREVLFDHLAEIVSATGGLL
ncbi:MAG: hypothetical protein ACYDHY_18330 [Acidiferrobacterales bacterium]